MTKIKTSYTTALSELEKILSELENNIELDMEEVSVMVKRAAELLEICKSQLHIIDKDLEKIIENLD